MAKRLYDVLKDCKKEEEVKASFCSFFKMKLDALKGIDHYRPTVFFEFKYDRNFRNISNIAHVIDQYGALADVFDVRFSTRYNDRETGLVSYKRRFYRPEHGRWLNRDPIEEDGGENLYALCRNAPVFYVDREGLIVVQENLQMLYDLTTGVSPGKDLGRTDFTVVSMTPCECDPKRHGWRLKEAIIDILINVHHQMDGYKGHPGAALFSYSAERQHTEDVIRGVKDRLIPELISLEMILKLNSYASRQECEQTNRSKFTSKIAGLVSKITQDSESMRDSDGGHTWKGGL